MSWQRLAELARENRQLAAVWLGSFVLLALPDLVCHLLGYQTASVFKTESMALAAVLALALTAVRSRPLRLTAVGLVLVCQALWLGCLAFFGRPLGPEQIMLAVNEVADVTSGILDSWRVLAPPLLTVAVSGALLVVLQRREVGARSLREWAGGYVLAALLAVSAGYWLTHKRFIVTIPGAQTFSALGPYQASVSLVRLLASPVAASPGMQVSDQTVTPVALEEQPVTIVVIMGEGVSPLRLSLFGFKDETTPRLDAWRSDPPKGFALISRIGFSGGVATFGSVPTFLKMAYWPVETEWRGINLFDLARRSGFKSWYFSAQSRHFLDAAGGAPGSERVVTDQGNAERLARQHDDMLIDLAREVPAEPKRRFVFFHQRVNHSNYTSHCSHLPKDEQRQLYAIKAADNSREALRRSAYDNGLRCWDRNVDELARVFLASPGAIYVLVTSDHGEMMGEHGLWGHSQPDLRVAQVPMLLMTNRPASNLARRFAALAAPNWYDLAQLVAAGLGHDVKTPNARDGRFYLNTTMPFGRSGYMEVDRIAASRFKVRHFTREGQKRSETELALPEMAAANAAAVPAN